MNPDNPLVSYRTMMCDVIAIVQEMCDMNIYEVVVVAPNSVTLRQVGYGGYVSYRRIEARPAPDWYDPRTYGKWSW